MKYTVIFANDICQEEKQIRTFSRSRSALDFVRNEVQKIKAEAERAGAWKTSHDETDFIEGCRGWRFSLTICRADSISFPYFRIIPA